MSQVEKTPSLPKNFIYCLFNPRKGMTSCFSKLSSLTQEKHAKGLFTMVHRHVVYWDFSVLLMLN
jgi:hypothetical protein